MFTFVNTVEKFTQKTTDMIQEFQTGKARVTKEPFDCKPPIKFLKKKKIWTHGTRLKYN